MSKKIEIGDWIRFQRDNRLVIGVVSYIEPYCGYYREPAAVTVEHGAVFFDKVLEVRHGGPHE